MANHDHPTTLLYVRTSSGRVEARHVTRAKLEWLRDRLQQDGMMPLDFWALHDSPEMLAKYKPEHGALVGTKENPLVLTVDVMRHAWNVNGLYDDT